MFVGRLKSNPGSLHLLWKSVLDQLRWMFGKVCERFDASLVEMDGEDNPATRRLREKPLKKLCWRKYFYPLVYLNLFKALVARDNHLCACIEGKFNEFVIGLVAAHHHVRRCFNLLDGLSDFHQMA